MRDARYEHVAAITGETYVAGLTRFVAIILTAQ